MKRRNSLQVLMESVECVSLANGDIRVTPKWAGVREYTEGEGGGPGIFMRMAGAARLQKVINAHLRAKK